jgi:hypothetical protein
MRTDTATKAAIIATLTPTAVHDLTRRGFWYSRLLTTKVIAFLLDANSVGTFLGARLASVAAWLFRLCRCLWQ